MTNLQTSAFLKALQEILIEREAAARTRNDQLLLEFTTEVEKMNRRRHKALDDRLAVLEQRLSLMEGRK